MASSSATDPATPSTSGRAGVTEDRPDVVELDRSECLALVGSLSIGRLALTRRGAAPLVVPVNYVLDGEVIVFRTDPGTKLARLSGARVSFQVDLVDPFHHTGWSVLVCGVAREASSASTSHLELESWAGGPKRHWIHVEPESVSGRRIRLADVELDARGYR